MLTEEENTLLSRIGPDTPMGDLFRRYWMPACLASELPEAGGAPMRVRLLGEDLVAFRDTSGRAGLLARNCPHRGASLYFARNEEGPEGACGLRCVYHGWQFDVDGACVDVPSEPRGEAFKRGVRVTAYPTHESGGIVWAYLGPPETRPPFRDFGTESLDQDQVSATKVLIECNWAQSLEGNVDTAHIGFLHQFHASRDIPDDGTDQPGYNSNILSWKFWQLDHSPRLEVEDTWYGFKYAGVRVTPNGHTHVRITALTMPSTTMVAHVPFSSSQLIVVPIDDERCWRYSMSTQAPSNVANLGGAPGAAVGPFVRSGTGNGPRGLIARDYHAGNDYQIDRLSQRNSTFSGVLDFASQDFMVTESMGTIYDRGKEHLGSTDVAVIRLRTMLMNAARALATGVEPPATGRLGNYRAIRGAEKILEPGEDWRVLGTDEDPVVREALHLADVDR